MLCDRSNTAAGPSRSPFRLSIFPLFSFSNCRLSAKARARVTSEHTLRAGLRTQHTFVVVAYPAGIQTPLIYSEYTVIQGELQYTTASATSLIEAGSLTPTKIVGICSSILVFRRKYFSPSKLLFSNKEGFAGQRPGGEGHGEVGRGDLSYRSTSIIRACECKGAGT